MISLESLLVSKEALDLIPLDMRESLEKQMQIEIKEVEYLSWRYHHVYIHTLEVIDRHAKLEREAYRHIISKLLEKQKLEPRTIPPPLEKSAPEPVVKKLGQGRRKFPEHLFKSSLT